MSESEAPDSGATTTEQQDAAEQQEKKLGLDVTVDAPTACERKVTVTVAREDIDRYFEDAFTEMMPKAEVPGFRVGRVPRQLIVSRFRKDVEPQVKGSLILDSVTQVGSDQDFSAISEPDLDIESIDLPAEGPLVFEYSIEVRPEFELPNWKGLKLEKPVREFSDEDVQRRLESLLTRFGSLTPKEDAAKEGDYITVDLTIKDGDKVVSHAEEEVIRIRPILSFRDGKIENFGELMEGVKAGDTREGEVLITSEASNPDVRGKKLQAIFEVKEVKQLELPELTSEFLQEIGGFDSEAGLRDFVRDDLERQLGYQQSQKSRAQVTASLVESANWDLPPDLLRRQSVRELERSVLELRRSGFSEDEIRAHSNELRQNTLESTESALKEHFILERIAEEENIEDEPADYDAEIALIASQSGESIRRTRAQLEKRGMMDSLRNQIIEQKVLDLIYKHAEFTEVPYQPSELNTEAVDQSAGGEVEESDIPNAKEEKAAEQSTEQGETTSESLS